MTASADSSFWPASCGSASSRLRVCSRGVLPPRSSWKACTMNSISRMPPGPELDVLLQFAPLDFARDQVLHAAQRLEHAEVEVAAVHEGPQRIAMQLGEAGLGAVHGPRLDVGVALPVATVLLQVVLHRIEAHRDRAGIAEGPQAQVDAIDEAIVGRAAEQLRHALAGAHEEFLVRERPRTGGFAVLGKQEDQVDVGREVEFAAAELAHAQHQQRQGLALLVAWQAVTRTEHRSGLPAGHADARVGQRRQLCQHLLDRSVTREIAPCDAHELPAPERHAATP